MKTKEELTQKLEETKKLLKTETRGWQYLFGFIDALEFSLSEISNYKKRYG